MLQQTEPTVISQDLIQTAITDHLKIDVVEVARREGVESSEVLGLRLDYKSSGIFRAYKDGTLDLNLVV